MSSSENTLPFGADKTLAVALSVRVLARSGAIAGIIKLASAGLSFIMFVAVALVTDERQFGLYSATYAGASLISFFASVGQQSAVLRFWPQYTSLGDLPAAQGFMRRSLLVTLCGLLVTSLGIAAIGFLPGVSRNTPEWLPLCLSAALLSFDALERRRKLMQAWAGYCLSGSPSSRADGVKAHNDTSLNTTEAADGA